MSWLTELPVAQPVAYAVLVLAGIAVCGLALSALRIRGVGLGIAGVLFAGILFGHLGFHIEPAILAFVREFGLILFVFTIGLQLGPGFFASLRRDGLRLNLLAVGVVVLGVAITILTCILLGYDRIAAVGLFTGATTNTPALGAAQESLRIVQSANPDAGSLPALAYAVAYPIGILGSIGTLLVLRSAFRIDAAQEAEAYRAAQIEGTDPLERINFVIENPNLAGLRLGEVPGRVETGVIVSRIRHAGGDEVRTATLDTVLGVGDILLVVGTRKSLESFGRVVGHKADLDLLSTPGRVRQQRVIVTRKDVVGKTLAQIGLDALYGVTVTRVTRAYVEVTAVPHLRLQFGDMLVVVGEEASLKQASDALGNSVQALNETNFIPIFVGIAFGVLLGSLPVYLPGMPAAIRLGLAGGPLLLAIVLSRIGRIGPLLWYMPLNANIAFRELGIVLFLACVGLKAGERFFETVLTPRGLVWLCAAALITALPLLIVGITARRAFKLNFTSISGLIAGSMTDPPALAFASAIAKSDAPSVAYATVYPLTMLLRIFTAQLLVLFFAH
jgi:putative transport protein